jgi:hypothetical protein
MEFFDAGNYNQIQENMLYEMMSIDENKGQVPSIFIHTIED